MTREQPLLDQWDSDHHFCFGILLGGFSILCAPKIQSYMTQEDDPNTNSRILQHDMKKLIYQQGFILNCHIFILYIFFRFNIHNSVLLVGYSSYNGKFRIASWLLSWQGKKY